MAKIPFDIKFRPQIESGEYKVITAKEQPVRIICWDRSTTYWKIIALVLAPDGKTENPFTYDVEGKESDGCLHDHELDLFLITPEPELSEFEVKLWEIMKAEGSPVGPREKFTNDDKRAFHEYSTQLISLARNEIVKSGYAIIEGEHYLEEGRKNYERGKAEALKDLPKWVKVDEGVLLDKSSKYLLYSNGVYYYCCGSTITRDGYMLLVDDLEKLSKEDEK